MILILCVMFFTTVTLFFIGLSMRSASVVLIQDRMQHLAQPVTGAVSVIEQEIGAPFSERVIRPILLQLSPRGILPETRITLGNFAGEKVMLTLGSLANLVNYAEPDSQ